MHLRIKWRKTKLGIERMPTYHRIIEITCVLCATTLCRRNATTRREYEISRWNFVIGEGKRSSVEFVFRQRRGHVTRFVVCNIMWDIVLWFKCVCFYVLVYHHQLWCGFFKDDHYQQQQKKSYDERIREVREREAKERQRKLDQMLNSLQRAEEIRKKHDEERLKKRHELRMREEERRQMVDVRRKKLEEDDSVWLDVLTSDMLVNIC